MAETEAVQNATSSAAENVMHAQRAPKLPIRDEGTAANIQMQNDLANSGEIDDYTRYGIGDLVGRGMPIRRIYLQSRDQIVFTSDGGRIHFEGRNHTPTTLRAIQEFQRIRMEADSLQGAYRREFLNVLASALSWALNSNEDKIVDEAIERVKRFLRDHLPLQRVMAQTDEYTVFINREGRLQFEYQELPASLSETVAELQKLEQIAALSLRGPDAVTASQMLGTELAARFRVSQPSDNPFPSSKAFIEARADAANRATYVVASGTAAILLSIVALVLGFRLDSVSQIMAAAGGGAIGALLSLLQRTETLHIRQFVPRSQIIIQASFRIVSGALFAILALFAAQAELAFTSFLKSAQAALLLAVVVGFSERLVPDLLASFESNKATGAG